MNVDSDSLEHLNLRTRDGAERAGTAFETIVGDETRVGTTKITVASHDDLIAELLSAGEEFIEFDLEGPLSGTVLLAFDSEVRTRIHDSVGSTEATEKGAIVDFSLDLISEFVTEWEGYVDGDLTVDAPTYIDSVTKHDLGIESVAVHAESVPIFQSSIHGLEVPGCIRLYLIPDSSSLDTLLSVDAQVDAQDGDGADAFGMGASDTDDATTAFGVESDGGSATADAFAGGSGSEAADAFGMGADDSDDDTEAVDAFGGPADDTEESNGGSSLFEDDHDPESLPLDKLSVFSDLTREGTTTAADRITQMTGVQTESDVSGIHFTPIDDISIQMEDGQYVGTTTKFEGTPSGHLVIIFGASSAQRIAEAMLPMEPEGEGLTPMHESALEELGNIMTSGFIDGWANVLQTSVEHTPPEFTDDMDMKLLEIVTDQLGPFQTHAYTIESRIKTDDIEFDCEIHALPNEAKLSQALDSLAVDRRDQTDADPDDVF